MDPNNIETVFHGIQASPGIAIGNAMVIDKTSLNQEILERSIEKEEVETEIKRFNGALDKTRNQLKELQKRVQTKLDEKEAKIFDAHLLIVDDKMLTDEVEDMIRQQLKSADFAFDKTIKRYVSAISRIDDQYIRERVADINDVAGRILFNLRGEAGPILDHLPGQRIIIAHDLTPSETALLDRENVQAFAIESGSRTSHTAILARSMKIPSVVGIEELMDRVKSGDLLIVDGYVGTVIINPSDESLNKYAQKETREEKLYEDMMKEHRLLPETIDGFRVQLAANIEQPDDVIDAKDYGAAGIGLYRTEYLFINSSKLPTEEEQFEVYKKIAQDMSGQTVIIRTLDLGGDKFSELISPQYELNPFLGFRAIRFCLQYEHIFRSQLRAILRASPFGNIKIMFPMITCLEELKSAKKIFDEEKEKLLQEKISFNQKIEIGMMIEIPSAALISKHFAKEVDFFSIGTNDLVQYTMAVDRSNEKVAYLYQPSHPAILSLIKDVVLAARENHIWVSICGEMAGDPRYVPILAGLGIHELSMSPISIGPVRRIIRRLRMYEAEEVAAEAIQCSTAEEALELSESFLYRVAPDVMSLAMKGL